MKRSEIKIGVEAYHSRSQKWREYASLGSKVTIVSDDTYRQGGYSSRPSYHAVVAPDKGTHAKVRFEALSVDSYVRLTELRGPWAETKAMVDKAGAEAKAAPDEKSRAAAARWEAAEQLRTRAETAGVTVRLSGWRGAPAFQIEPRELTALLDRLESRK